uniref:Putative alpha toxin Tx108 n=1 Tax=Buthus israelis TaxID=2899555 RepID=B8XGY2_BUTIS|nr:putative alpha toxin Tx108 [Buthus occitanus israelis]
MNYLVMTSLALLFMMGVAEDEEIEVRNGYIVYPNNCIYHCWRDSYCTELCTENRGKGGECHWMTIKWGNACYCFALPEDVPIKDESYKCSR